MLMAFATPGGLPAAYLIGELFVSHSCPPNYVHWGLILNVSEQVNVVLRDVLNIYLGSQPDELDFFEI